MSVTFTREEIERTITERMRLRAIALGFLPDVTLFAGNMPGWEAARQAIINGGKQLIDIFGVGANESRGEKNINRIFLNLRQYNNGSVSHWGDSSYIQTGPNQFARQEVYGSTRTLIYDIRSVTGGDKSTEYDRICLDIVMGAITNSFVGVYFPVLDSATMNFDTTRRFLVRFTGSQEIKTTKFFERLMTFEVVDVWLDGSTNISNSWDTTLPTINIVPLTQVIGEGGQEGEPPEIIIDIQP